MWSFDELRNQPPAVVAASAPGLAREVPAALEAAVTREVAEHGLPSAIAPTLRHAAALALERGAAAGDSELERNVPASAAEREKLRVALHRILYALRSAHPTHVNEDHAPGLDSGRVPL